LLGRIAAIARTVYCYTESDSGSRKYESHFLWPTSVLRVSFSTSTLLVGWQ